MELKIKKVRKIKKMVTTLLMSLVVLFLIYSCAGNRAGKDKGSSSTAGRIDFGREFAPSDGMVKGAEKEVRKEICLNGKWDFQPVYEPYNQAKTSPYGINASDVAPDLPSPTEIGWDNGRIKIPSSWTSVEQYPSYPEQWRRAQMGWLRKKFNVPADWNGKRIVLHFQAVSGDCKIFLNGEQVGSNFDSTTPFEIDITEKVKKGLENEIMVGIRSHGLFVKQGSYGKLSYTPGGRKFIGIWQDVYLVALPKVFVSDVYIMPEVSENLLIAEVTVKNATAEDQTVSFRSVVSEWVNLAGTDMLTAPEVKWKLGKEALQMNEGEVKILAGKEATVILQSKIKNELKFWDFENPNLYGIVVTLQQGGRAVDKKYERFGWREFKIEGKKLLLNGKLVQLLGDSQHLQNESYLSRRFAWSWFRLLKDAGANAARFHAVVWPGYFHDMADEMGIAILPESSVYASSCDINYDSDLFWKSAKYNVDGMVRMYRNHPSVYGWSIENEVLPALNVKCDDPAYKKMVYDGMGRLAGICRSLDPTRNWISGDGSRDMDGRLPVYNVHYGSTTSYKEESSTTSKPFGVGEACIAYYSTPRQSEMYVGDRAYRSYKDHSDAVAIDTYELLKVQRQLCTYCSVWNLGYYAVEELPFGLSDLSKAPTKDQGIFFTAEYIEGKPGSQIERIPPYGNHYNPGYDPGMPLYKPLPMYYAIKAAYHQPEPEACEWDHRQVYKTPSAPEIKNPEKEVLFFGEEGGDLFFKLKNIGIPLVMNSSDSKAIIVDCNSVKINDELKVRIETAVKEGSRVIFWGLTTENQAQFGSLLPYPVEVFDRMSTSLVPNEKDNRFSSIPFKDMYFSENTDSKIIMKYAMKGDFVTKGDVQIRACPTDWSKGNNGGMMRSERENPEGPSLVELKKGKGAYLLSTLNIDVVTPAHIRLISQLFRNLGVEMKTVQVRRGSLFNQTSVLTKSLIAGYYKAGTSGEAFKKDFVGGETSIKPEFETVTNGCKWNVEESKNGLFNFNRSRQENGSVENGTTVYLSFWLQCPQPLNEIMTDPNVPVVNFNFSAAGSIKLWLNGQEKFSSMQSVSNGMVEKLPLKKGWNQFLVKVVKSGNDWNFTGRLLSKDLGLLSSMGSALNPYSERANFYKIMHTDPEIVYDQGWGLQGDGWYESATPGAKAVFKFYGTGVTLTGLVFPNGGKAKIYIDGKFDKVVDYKSAERDPHNRYYSRSGLPNGEHEVKVEVVEGWVSVGPYEQWESFK
jgi:hypothetical protein